MRSILQKKDLSNTGLSFHTSPKPNPPTVDPARGRGRASPSFHANRGRGRGLPHQQPPSYHAPSPSPSYRTPSPSRPLKSSSTTPYVSKSTPSTPLPPHSRNVHLNSQNQNQVPRNLTTPKPPSSLPCPPIPCQPPKSFVTPINTPSTPIFSNQIPTTPVFVPQPMEKFVKPTPQGLVPSPGLAPPLGVHPVTPPFYKSCSKDILIFTYNQPIQTPQPDFWIWCRG